MKKKADRTETRRARGILYRWGRVTETLQGIHQQIRGFEALIADARALGAQRYDGMPGSTEPGDPTAARAAKAMALIDEYHGVMDRLMERAREEAQLKLLVDEHIAQLLPVEQELVRLRYGQRLQWVTVAMRMGYSEDAVRKMDQSVISRLSESIF